MALQDLIPALVDQAENEGDQATKGALHEVLLTLFGNNDPRDQDFWIDLYQYRGRLLNGDEGQKETGHTIDQRMREIRREVGTRGSSDASK